MPTIGLRIDRVHAHRGNDRKPSTATRTVVRASGKSTEELTAELNAFLARIKKGK